MRGRLRGRGGRTSRARPRAAARIAIVAGAALVTFGLFAPSAGANYARVDARAGCDRVVTWRASASVEGTDEQRTNERVLVDYRERGSDDVWSPAGPQGSFDAANDFSFSGSFDLPDGVDAVEVRVRPVARWGPGQDGDEPGGPRFAITEVPAGCQGQPLAATQQLDCARGAVVVEARNVGGAPLDAEVVVDRVVARELQIGAGSSAELVVPVLPGRPTQIEVRGGQFVASDQLQGGECEVPGPTAVVLERCGAPAGRLVVLATGGGRRVEAAVQVRGSTVDRAEIPAGTTLQRTLEVPATAVAVEVTLDGQVAAAGLTGGCDGPVAGLLPCGTAGRASCDLTATRPTTPPPPPPPPPPLQIDGGPLLPHTGPAQRAIGLLLGGALVLVGGVSLAARDRRRPVRSLLAEAIAPYRQPWWDES